MSFMWDLLFFVIYVLIATTSAATISPTSVSADGKTQYYKNSEWTGSTGNLGYFYNDDIHCGTEICHLVCDAQQGCGSVTLTTDPTTTTLIVECSNADSCDSLHMYADTVANIDIQCNYNASTSATAACYRLQLDAQHSGTTTVYCNDMNCDYLKLYLDDADALSLTAQGFEALTYSEIYTDRIKNGLNIVCNGTSERYQSDASSNACGNTEFYTREMSSDVSLTCYDNDACDFTRLNSGTMTGDISVTCSGQSGDSDHACYYLWLYAQDIAGSLSVNCVGGYNCDNIQVYCPSMKAGGTCNIECLAANACDGADVMIDDQYEDTINLECSTDATSCSNLRFDCEKAAEGHSTLSWNDANSEFQCDPSSCCPLVNRTESCVAGTDCKIDCSQSCGGYVIDGATANTLRVNCTGDYSCDGAKIICPTGIDADCIIDCPGFYSCQYMSIVTGTSGAMNLFQMNCFGHGSYGCYRAYAALDATSISTLDLNCYGSIQRSCLGLNLVTNASINTANIICGLEGCQIADYAFGGIITNLNFDCAAEPGEKNACYNMRLSAKIENTDFTLHCESGAQSCFLSSFYVESVVPDADFSILCNNPSSTSISAGCEKTSFHITGYEDINGVRSTRLAINCTGPYMCDNAEFYGYQLGAMNASCDDEYACVSGTFNGESCDAMNLDCIGSYSCNLNSVYCPYKDIGACNIDCRSGGNTCNGLAIHVPSSEYVYGYLDLTCESNENITVDALDTCTGLNINCDDGSGSPVTYQYNHTINDYECSDFGSSYCCPYWKGPSYSPTTALPTVSPTTTIPTASPITANPTTTPTTTIPTVSPITTIPTASPTTANPTMVTDNPTKTVTDNPTTTVTNNLTLTVTTLAPTNTPTTPTTAQPSVSPITAQPSNVPTTSIPTETTETTESGESVLDSSTGSNVICYLCIWCAILVYFVI